MPEFSVVVFATCPSEREPAFVERTLRVLRAEGLAPENASACSLPELGRRIAGRSVWLLRAGVFPASTGSFVVPPPSASGRPLGAMGVVRALADTGKINEAADFERLLSTTGGDFSNPAPWVFPPLPSVYCEPALSTLLSEHLFLDEPLHIALPKIAARGACRLVRVAALDVLDDERLRVLLVVTSLQQGGAEKMVIDLAKTLPMYGIRPRIVTLGRPTRDVFAAPPNTIDLSRSKDRITALAEVCANEAADLVHCHLLTGDEIKRLKELGGPPVVMTVHNTRAGWPAGLHQLDREDVSLMVACSLAAEQDLAQENLPIPRRTVWNGIDLQKRRLSPPLREEGDRIRVSLGLGKNDILLVVVANPRHQKRLDRLPSVLATLRRLLAKVEPGREARLLLVGDKDPRVLSARAVLDELQVLLAKEGVTECVHFAGSMVDVGPMLAASDVLVSTSAHEGLSLAHLEALAMGLPVVAMDAGGTAEIAFEAPSLMILPQEATPEQMAQAILTVLSRKQDKNAKKAPELPSFSRETMSKRYSLLYRRVLNRRVPRRKNGLLLITNNFSTGGAQSSGRRLLLGLAAAGVQVRACVLEEQPQWPTPGRRDLMEAGIEVFALPQAGSIAVEDAVDKLVAWIDADPPEAILFWNALAPYKLLLADVLFETRIFDVSPGEMFFASLDRYFSKTRIRGELPCRDGRDYGARLSGVIVKYAAEACRAEEVLGAKTFVVPNGVPLPARRPFRPPGPVLIMGTSARISPQKKLEQLVDALRLASPRLPPHVLRIAGGPERGAEVYAEELRQRAEGLSVEWLGDVDISEFLPQIDVFVMISEPAGCPNASLEAMAHGLSVIATDFGGASEQVQDGITGRLVPRGDVAAFAAAMVEVAHRPEEIRTMGNAGRMRAEALFDVTRMVVDYERICLSGAHTDR